MEASPLGDVVLEEGGDDYDLSINIYDGMIIKYLAGEKNNNNNSTNKNNEKTKDIVEGWINSLVVERFNFRWSRVAQPHSILQYTLVCEGIFFDFSRYFMKGGGRIESGVFFDDGAQVTMLYGGWWWMVGGSKWWVVVSGG